MGVVSAEKEQHDGDTKKKLLGRRVLSTVVNLLPHVKVVEGSAVEFERDAADVVKHDIRAEHVRDVCECP